MEEVEWYCNACKEYFEAKDSDIEIECPLCGSDRTEKTE